MRFSLHTVLCCCVFTTVLPLATGAAGEPIAGLKKRLRVWLQGHMKRDLRSGVESVGEQSSGKQAGLHANALSAPSSSKQNRAKRSTSSKSAGCFLITCVYHDLLHRLYELKNNQKEEKAPKEKLGYKGYGRRRRSLLDATKGRSSGPHVHVGGHASTVA